MVVSCPACLSPMRAHTLKGIAVDRCDACLGTWFDYCELAAAAGCALPPLQQATSSARTCPPCGMTMDQARMGPVQVERCRRCKGVFLDGGEFERLRRGATPRSAPVAVHAVRGQGPDTAGLFDGLAVLLELIAGLP